jgi:lysophospholipase L1-like esterase
VPRPGYPSHDSRGFRNPELAEPKREGSLRIACLGASTTYGHELLAEEAWPAQLERLLRADGLDVEVVNAGVPGWVSRETVISLEERVLAVEPDVVVVYQGRNELFPQAYNGYRDDYAHFRDPDWDFARTNRAHKAVFRLSRLALVLCTWRGDRFGWEGYLENPVYGCNVKANVPTPAETVANLLDPARTGGYRANVERLVASARAAGAEVLLCTMAFRAERFATGMLHEDPSIHPALAAQVDENNEVVREIARRLGVPLAETAAMAGDEGWFRDDCHMTAAGHARRAEIVRGRLLEEGLVPRGG